MRGKDGTRRTVVLLAIAAASIVGLWLWRIESPRSRDAPQRADASAAVAAQAAPRADAAGGSAAPAATGGCDHPFVPTAAGAWRRYQVQRSGTTPLGQREVEYRIERAAAEAGAWRTQWRVTVMPSSAGAKDGRSIVLQRSCSLGGAAEDPWSGEVVVDVDKTSGSLWRWPRKLEPGLTFGGRLDVVPRFAGRPGVPELMAIEQHHTVEAEQAIAVPAGEFQTWRVRFDGIHDLGARKAAVSGRLWIARDVGLVESVIKVDDISSKTTLLGFGG